MPNLNEFPIPLDLMSKLVKEHLSGSEFEILEEGPDPMSPNKFIPKTVLFSTPLYLSGGLFGVTSKKSEALFAVTREGAEQLITAFEAA